MAQWIGSTSTVPGEIGFVPEPFGPDYPDLGAGVAKFRKRGPVAKMPKAMRREYGEAVEKAIRAKQRQELMREGTSPRAVDVIGEARLQRLRAALQASVGKERREREPDEWKAMYEEAMKQKRAAPPPIEMKKVKGKILLTFPRLPDGSKTVQEIIASNRLRCRYSHRDQAYLATPDQVAKLEQLVASL